MACSVSPAGVSAVRGRRRHITRTCSCCGSYSSGKVTSFSCFPQGLKETFMLIHRLCHGSNSPPTTATSLRAAISTNLRQYCSPAPRNGVYTAPYEETYSVPPVVDSEDLWRLAHQLSMQVGVQNFHFSFTISLSLSPSILAQHSQVNATAAAEAANVFQNVLGSRRR